MATMSLSRLWCRASAAPPAAMSSSTPYQRQQQQHCGCFGGLTRGRVITSAFPTEGGPLAGESETIPEHSMPVGGSEESFDIFPASIWAKLGLVGLAAAALCCTSPALAYKGGGPYGSEVTRGQDLSGRDFSGRTLIKQDFKTSILRQANFKGATLTGASFFDSDLTGADLTNADLRGADFSLANIAKANLTNANLEGALVTGNTSFKGAIITGADFTDVLVRDDQRVQLCQAAKGVNSSTGNATRETLLCDL